MSINSELYCYMAGPISGLSYDVATDWRNYTTDLLEAFDIIGVSPLRNKTYLSSEKKIEGSYAEHPLSNDRGIVTRDFLDVSRCDAVLMNLLDAEKVSIGTMFEAAWAFELRKPLFVVIEDEGNIHDHPFLREATSFRVNDLKVAAELVSRVLQPWPVYPPMVER